MKRITEIKENGQEEPLGSMSNQNHFAGHDMQENPLKNIYNPTTLPLNEQQMVKSRSLKPKVDYCQISFEESFLAEHQAAFQREAKNFIEAAFKKLEQGNPIISQFWKEEDEFNEQELKLIGNDLLTRQERIQFQKDLETEQKFTKVLMMISRRVSEQVAKEMTLISLKVWEKYLKIKNIFFNYDELMRGSQEFVKKEADQLFNESGIKFLNLSEIDPKFLNSEEEQKEAFKNFIKFWATTVLLAIEEYFENPYSGEPCLKRERSYDFGFDYSDSIQISDGGSFLGGPTKRVFSFDN